MAAFKGATRAARRPRAGPAVAPGMRGATRWADTAARTTVHAHDGLAYFPRPARITAVLDEARRWSERPFIIQGARVISFADHERMMRTFPRRLRQEGVRGGDRVGIFAANSPEWVAMFFAILAVGAIAVPCNGWWSAEEMAHACAMVQPSLLICD